MSSTRLILLLAGLAGLTGVLAGTFGAHGLRERLTPQMLETFEIGVRYQLIHAVALLTLAALSVSVSNRRALAIIACLFASGILIFSGTLYALAITGHKWLGMITPVGGTLFIVGWVCLIVMAVRATPGPSRA